MIRRAICTCSSCEVSDAFASEWGTRRRCRLQRGRPGTPGPGAGRGLCPRTIGRPRAAPAGHDHAPVEPAGTCPTSAGQSRDAVKGGPPQRVSVEARECRARHVARPPPPRQSGAAGCFAAQADAGAAIGCTHGPPDRHAPSVNRICRDPSNGIRGRGERRGVVRGHCHGCPTLFRTVFWGLLPPFVPAYSSTILPKSCFDRALSCTEMGRLHAVPPGGGALGWAGLGIPGRGNAARGKRPEEMRSPRMVSGLQGEEPYHPCLRALPGPRGGQTFLPQAPHACRGGKRAGGIRNEDLHPPLVGRA